MPEFVAQSFTKGKVRKCLVSGAQSRRVVTEQSVTQQRPIANPQHSVEFT